MHTEVTSVVCVTVLFFFFFNYQRTIPQQQDVAIPTGPLHTFSITRSLQEEAEPRHSRYTGYLFHYYFGRQQFEDKHN